MADFAEEIEICIDESKTEYIGLRIDKFLSEELPEFSRAYLQKLVDEKNILVNHNNIKSNYKLKKSDIINIYIPEPEELEIVPENIPLNIVYEDNDIIIVDKQGMCPELRSYL